MSHFPQFNLYIFPAHASDLSVGLCLALNIIIQLGFRSTGSKISFLIF